MLSQFGAVIVAALNVFNTDITIYGFTFAFFDVFLWSILAGFALMVLLIIFGR